MRLVLTYLRIIPYFLLGASALHAQTPRDTALSIASIDRDVANVENALERAVWPGYYFTQLGVMYVIPGRAKLAAHWPSNAPEGMRPLEGFPGVLWTDTGVVRWQAGLPVASMAVSPTQSRAAVAGTAMHEAFHAFEVTQRRDGRRFGAGENAMVTARYPVFDVENEALFAVEAKLLRRAMLAASVADARSNARQFLAVRRRRQARLDSVFVNYEKAAELHEGLAQYTLLRGLAELALHDAKYRAGAAYEKNAESELLSNTLAASNLSVRRRAYAMGSFMGLLLDRLAGSTWKPRVMRDDAWLQDILASAVGTTAVSLAVEAEIERTLPIALASVGALRTARLQQRDSLGKRGALLLVLDPMPVTARFEWCGFDPQNLLPSGNGQLMHTRMVNLCAAGKRIAGIFQPAVEDQFTGRVQTAVDPGELQISVEGKSTPLPAVGTSVAGEHVVVKTRDVEIELTRGILIRGEGRLLIMPLR